MDRKAGLGRSEDPLARRFVRSYLPRIRRLCKPAEVWLFGSRIRGDSVAESDLDVIVVSGSFEGIPWPDRGASLMVKAGITGAVELFCYTPEEFKRKRREYGVVRAAVGEGRRL